MSYEALIEKIRSLPSERVAEVEEFVDLLRTRNARAASELSERAFARVWDNPEDAVYDRL